MIASTATRRVRAGPPHKQRVAPATRSSRRAGTPHAPTQRSAEPHMPQESSWASCSIILRFVAGGTTCPADNNTPIDRQPSDDYRVTVAELAVPSLETL